MPRELNTNRPALAKLIPACFLSGNLETIGEKTNAHSDTVNSVAFSPDGTKIVSGSNDRAIRIWDSGAPRAQNRAHPFFAPILTLDWLVRQESWGC